MKNSYNKYTYKSLFQIRYQDMKNINTQLFAYVFFMICYELGEKIQMLKLAIAISWHQNTILGS